MATIPRNQRVLILQGGVALGAYEAGVIKALSERLSKQDRENGEPNRPLFDIVAGTSIGAINAAILVNYVKQRKKWEGAADELIRFWHHIADPTPISGQVAELWLGEAGRRYYSAKEFFRRGIRNVFSPPSLEYDYRFYDNSLVYPDGLPNVSNNIWYRYSNQPLRDSIKKFVQSPIATTGPSLNDDHDNNNGFTEPRLIVVSVDVALGQAVAFDSYPREDGSRKTEYGKYDEQSDTFEQHTINYDEGIRIEHIMASASFPVFFDYEEIADRRFWDGGILSNTPLRELIGLHREYWTHMIPPNELSEGMWEVEDDEEEGRWKRTRRLDKTNNKVPSLDVYIVSVWPSIERNVPTDYDAIKDRKNDIAFHDKTEYDEKVTMLITDYIELVKRTRNIALEHIKDNNARNAFENELGKFLKRPIKSKSRTQSKGRTERRDYKSLIKGGIELNKVVRIERQESNSREGDNNTSAYRKGDIHNISSKFADFTLETINELIEEGIRDGELVYKRNQL